jgi:hypothetical protein
LKLQFKNASLFGLDFHVPPFRQQRRLDRHRLNGVDELADDRCVDAQPSKHHTPPLPEHHISTVASIDRLADPAGRAGGVIYGETTAAAAAH